LKNEKRWLKETISSGNKLLTENIFSYNLVDSSSDGNNMNAARMIQ